jgi:hypothetical protein
MLLTSCSTSAKAILVRRSCRDIPEFGDVLGTEEDGISLPDLPGDGMGSLVTLRMIGLSAAQKDIGVYQDTHQLSRPS